MITDRGQVKDTFYRLGENGEFCGTLRTVAEARLGQLYGGTVSDVGTRHMVMRQDHAQNGIQREEIQRFGSIFSFPVKGHMAKRTKK
ncbi:hypothetical protein NPIL_375981 [Nephila pilipes]|uniref:Uncharacterized protein n=1 Tax=Nephila pilipes TaxID=299642 RepID=A0A8X6PR14_NEPPI|nr:hypothetical protein NPIL_375981 [Nephila pilipes]